MHTHHVPLLHTYLLHKLLNIFELLMGCLPHTLIRSPPPHPIHCRPQVFCNTTCSFNPSLHCSYPSALSISTSPPPAVVLTFLPVVHDAMYNLLDKSRYHSRRQGASENPLNPKAEDMAYPMSCMRVLTFEKNYRVF